MTDEHGQNIHEFESDDQSGDVGINPPPAGTTTDSTEYVRPLASDRTENQYLLIIRQLQGQISSLQDQLTESARLRSLDDISPSSHSGDFFDHLASQPMGFPTTSFAY